MYNPKKTANRLISTTAAPRNKKAPYTHSLGPVRWCGCSKNQKAQAPSNHIG
jgi:hypothetical protein